MLLSAEHISKNYGMKQLFKDVSLYLKEKEKIGIIGVNGTGKSTLLKIIAGLETADYGEIAYNPNMKIVYLPQNPIMHENLTVIEQVFIDFDTEFRQENDYLAKSMLNKLGIKDFDAQISTLSGGQRKRVALAKTLLEKADILILDEPTNHLDSEMVSWLEEYLERFGGGLIMVTHDRYFLERIVTSIVELSDGSLYSYEANYSRYLELKAQRLEMEKASERKRQSILRKEYQWVMRGARARGTKSRERIERYETLRDKDSPNEAENIKMTAISSRLGKKIIEIDNIYKSFGEKNVIDGFSYMISRNDRVGIIGKNGAGKSTLLNIISGKLEPDSGHLDFGITVKIGYFMQECGEMDFEQRVYDYICQCGNEIKTDEGVFSASQMLERFLFLGDMQYMPIGRLSGGERRRLYLLGILMSAPNILLLDEPTNDLDIETLTILEDYIDSFQGAVIAVSHDRYFLDRISTSIFEVEDDGNIESYIGNYSDYLEKSECIKEISKSKEVKAEKAETKPEQKQRKLKFSFNEQREFESIDKDIENIENEIEICKREISDCLSDYVRLQELMDKKSELEEQLEYKTERWVYLNELDEKIKLQSK